jgi:hypothetical protein
MIAERPVNFSCIVSPSYFLKAGITINDARNLIYLPEMSSDFLLSTSAAVHKGWHRDEISDTLKTEVYDIF